MWVQDRVAKGELTAVKVKGDNNVAGCLTKHAERHKMDAYMKARGVVRRSGRRELCLQRIRSSFCTEFGACRMRTTMF